MKKGLAYLLVAVVMTMGLVTVGFANKVEDGIIKGKVIKIEGDMVTVMDGHKKKHTFHVDKHATKTDGFLEVGLDVLVDADKSGHANAIRIEPGKMGE